MKTRYMLTAAAMLLGAGPALAQSQVPLISREVFFGSPTRASPKISPDGGQISFLAADCV